MNAMPPKPSAGLPGSRLAWIILGAAGSALVAMVFFFNPATHPFYPVCQFHRLTGLNCPSCGMTRAAHALLHGEFMAALRDNALLVGGVFVLGARSGWIAFHKIRGDRSREWVPMRWLWLLLAAALIFTVLRNLPAGAFLSP
jgi:hypothetical protein